MATQIASSTEPASPLKQRFVTFGREYGWLCAGALLAATLASADGRKPEPADITAYRREINALPTEARQQLQHHKIDYANLHDEQRQQLRELHAAVTQDDALGETLSAYHQWLGKLSQDDRQKVLSESDPQKRLTAIREIRDAAMKRPEPRGTGPFPNGGLIPQLNRGDYESVLGVLSRRFQISLSPKDSSKLGLVEQHIKILDRLFELVMRDQGRPFAEPELIKDIVAAIRNPAQHEALMRLTNASRPLLMRMLLASLQREAKEAFAGDDPEDTKRKMMRALSPAEQAELKQFPLDQADWRLVYFRLKQERPDAAETFHKFFERFDVLEQNLRNRGKGPDDDRPIRPFGPDGRPRPFQPGPNGPDDRPGGDRRAPPRP